MQVHRIYTLVLLHFLSLVFASTLPAYIPSRRDRLSSSHYNSLIDTEAVNAASTINLVRRDWRDAHRNLFATTISIGGGWVAHYNVLDFVGTNVQVAVEELQEFYYQILDLGAIAWANQPPQGQREASLGGITLLLQSNAPVLNWEWIQGFLHDTIEQLQRSSGPGAPPVTGSFKLTFFSTVNDIVISAQKLLMAGTSYSEIESQVLGVQSSGTASGTFETCKTKRTAELTGFNGLAEPESDIEAVGNNRLSAENTNGQIAGLDDSMSMIDDQAIPRGVQVEKVVVLSFRTLQLQRIAELQDELLSLAVATTVPPGLKEKHKDSVDKALRAYADALRDYETLSLHAQPKIPVGAALVGRLVSAVGPEPRVPRLQYFWNDFLEAVGDRMTLYDPETASIVWKAVRSLLPDGLDYRNGRLPSEALEYMERTAGNLGFRELDQRGREERSQRQAFTQRVVMAMFGGAALIGPMLIMTLHPSRNTSLVTASVATFVFALLLAFISSDSAGKDVLGATAAYAAVLVVFVGSSMAPSS